MLISCKIVHKIRTFLGGCPVLTNPMNGAFGPVSNRLPGSTVTIQCDAGYVSAIVEVMCEEGTLMWSPDPETIMCVSLTQAPPTNQPTRELSSYMLICVYNSHAIFSSSNELCSSTIPTTEWRYQ